MEKNSLYSSIRLTGLKRNVTLCTLCNLARTEIYFWMMCNSAVLNSLYVEVNGKRHQKPSRILLSLLHGWTLWFRVVNTNVYDFACAHTTSRNTLSASLRRALNCYSRQQSSGNIDWLGVKHFMLWNQTPRFKVLMHRGLNQEKLSSCLHCNVLSLKNYFLTSGFVQ